MQEDENKGKGNQCRKNRRGKEKITKKEKDVEKGKSNEKVNDDIMKQFRNNQGKGVRRTKQKGSI